jgi:hypothetical protein
MEPWIIQILAIGSATSVALGFIALKGFSLWIKRRELTDQDVRIEELEHRLLELEERTDTTERLLGPTDNRGRFPREVDTPV